MKLHWQRHIEEQARMKDWSCCWFWGVGQQLSGWQMEGASAGGREYSSDQQEDIKQIRKENLILVQTSVLSSRSGLSLHYPSISSLFSPALCSVLLHLHDQSFHPPQRHSLSLPYLTIFFFISLGPLIYCVYMHTEQEIRLHSKSGRPTSSVLTWLE